MAKFPPDDDAPVPNAPNAAPSDDGNFRRGRFSPIVVGLALLAAAGGMSAFYFGVKTEQARMQPQELAKEKQNIFVLPEAEQRTKWREWAASPESDMVQEALIQLAFLEDESAIDLAVKALARKDHKINGVAAQVLAHFGAPKADAGKPALLAALKAADESDKPQILWALVTLREPSIFKDAVALYREAKLAKVQRVGGGNAFDPELLASLVPPEELATMAGDSSIAVRQLVATVLSRTPDPKNTDTLIKLVNDEDIGVAGWAATGLGKIGDEKAREPLLKRLSTADKDSRGKFLEALRDGIGGEGLVLALGSIQKDEEQREWFQTEQIFKMLEELADPRIGDPLMKWVESNPLPKPLAELEKAVDDAKRALDGAKNEANQRKLSTAQAELAVAGVTAHWRAEAGMRLAEIGDIRASKLLAERMALDPTNIYPKEKFWQHDAGGHLTKTDNQRVWAARMLADLALLHPDARSDLKAAESAVLKWSLDKPQPHANALRFLANIQSDKALPKLREWAFPTAPLPKEGAQPPFPTEFETAQSALRYVGRAKDESSYEKLLEQFKRKKDKKMDITTEGLQGAGLAMLGMALRAVAYGGAQGLGEFGDKRAVKPMMELIEDETWHEEARAAACESLAWCATPDDMKEIAKRAVKFGGDKNVRKQLIGACYSKTLALRPMPEAKADLVALLVPEMDGMLRFTIAQAIGASPIDDAAKNALFEKMKNPETRNAAALALILGGDASTAMRAVAMFGEHGPEALADMKDAYFRAFGFWSDEDLRNGNLYRWVQNAEAMSRVKVFDAPQNWAIERLQAQFDNLKFDNGPHSETRVVLRYRLVKAAKEGDDAAKANAIRTLKFMRERGSLMALRNEAGATGELAKKAFFQVMNPKPIVPEDISKLQAERAKSAEKTAAP
jgi:HEAT repeat protein